MLAQTQTSSKHILKSNSTTMATHIFVLSLYSNLSVVLALTYPLSQPPYKFSIDAMMPAHTSTWLFEQVHAHLVNLTDSHCKIFSPNQFAPPAATIQAFVNGAIGVWLPSHEKWVQVYSKDSEMSIIQDKYCQSQHGDLQLRGTNPPITDIH
jgi:hypothetical protein